MFSPVTYFYQPLEHALQFEISKKMSVISLYWFGAQQQTRTSGRQKMSLLRKI